MSLLGGILGHASAVTQEEIEKDVSPVLIDKEQIEHAYKLVRDLFIFTDKRLILLDKQGITGNKREYFSIPYKHISHFSIETSGHFDMDSELRIWLIGHTVPFKKEFKKGANIEEVQKTLATYILK
ncbi:MAG: PH domain-containing protein [Candidatus Levybacteria bacterium]|nr:PH domain-containing protein [Candidatus Levybacteria bacterium]